MRKTQAILMAFIIYIDVQAKLNAIPVTLFQNEKCLCIIDTSNLKIRPKRNSMSKNFIINCR